ncbi:hypothetical protein EB061_02400, partial [bacterium]|nr:hypothetical protein [bacterium]
AFRLAFLTQPSGTAIAGVSLPQQPQVVVLDTYGNRVTNSSSSITLVATSDGGCAQQIPGGLVASNATLAPTQGVAGFESVAINKIAAVRVRASTGDGVASACSNPISVSSNTPSALYSSIEATGPKIANGSDVLAVKITIKDAYENPVSGLIPTFSATNTSSANVYGPCSTTAADGVSNCSMTSTRAENKILSIDSPVSKAGSAVLFNSGAAATLTVSGYPADNIAGSTGSITVTVLDSNSNRVTGYLGTLNLQTSDSKATLPASMTLNSADAGQKTVSGISLKGAGTHSITLSDSVLPSLTGAQNGIVVRPAAFSAQKSVLSTPADTMTSRDVMPITLTAKDAFDNPNPAGISSTSAILFASTIVGGTGAFGSVTDQGSGVYTVSFTADKAGTVTLSSQISGSATGNTKSITILPAAATQLVLSGVGTPLVAGSIQNLTVTAKDANGNISTQYTGSIQIQSDDAQADLPAAAPLASGAGTFNLSLKSAGTRSITVTDGTLSTNLTGITVNPSDYAPSQSVVTVASPSVTSGNGVQVTLTAKDLYGNRNPSNLPELGYIFFTSTTSDGLGTFSPITNQGSGIYTSTFTGSKVGDVTLGANMMSVPVANTAALNIISSVATQLVLTAIPTMSTAGTSFNLKVTARDASNNVAVGYPGSLTFTSSDTSATIPGPVTLTNGTGTFPVTLKAAGNHTISVTDGNLSALSGNILVNPASASKLVLNSIPSSLVAGNSFNFNLTAQDAYDNVVVNYTGSPTFTSSDLKAVLPSTPTLINGTATFPATLRTSGAQTLTASDGTLSITSSPVTVSPAIFSTSKSEISVSAPTVVSGQTIAVTLTPKDAFGNLNPTGLPGSGSVSFSASLVGGSGTLTPTTDSGSGTFSSTFTGINSGSVTLGASMSGIPVASSATVTVNPGPATQLSLASIPSIALAGNAFTFGVTAKDANNNVATGYTGSIQTSSNDPLAVLPAASTLTNGTGTFSITLKSTGNRIITVRDGSLSLNSSSISVASSGATSLVISSVPASTVAGNSFSFSVTAKDAFNNTVTGYDQTITVSASDAQAELPAPGGLVNGVGTFTVNLKTAGSQNLSIGDGSLNATSSSISVTPAAYSTVESVVSASSASVISGNSILVTLTMKDSFGNSNPTGIPTIGNISLTQSLIGGNGTFGQLSNSGFGVFTGSFTGVTAGSLTVSATVSGVPVANNASISVTPGPATQLVLSNVPASVTSGESIQIAVTAKDSNNNTATGYSRTLTFSSSDSQASLPSSPSIANGTGSYAIVLKSVGLRTFTVTDGTLSATSPGVNVTSAPASSLVLSSVPANIQAGAPFTITVTARDPAGNTVTGYTGVVGITSSDGQAELPSSASLNNGVGSFTLTLKTAGANRITASDGTLSVVSQDINTTPAQASSLVLSNVPTSVNAGNPFNLTLTAKDPYNNTVTGYPGIISFTNSDPQGVVSNPSGLTNGTGTFAFTFKTVGSQTIAAGGGSLSVTTAAINVVPANASVLVLTGIPSTSTAGTPVTFTVTAKDAFNNIATGYTGTVAIASSDSNATLPNSAQLTNGAGSFTATLKTSGGKTITAADGTLTATSPSISVSPAAASQLIVTNVPPTQVAGTPISITVTARDAYNNVATGYAGSVSVVSSDISATLPAPATLTNGTRTISATLKTAGINTIGVEDGSLNSTNTNITITPGAYSVAQSVVTSSSSVVTSGSQIQVTLTAKDAFGNSAPTGMPSLSSISFTSSVVGGTGTFTSISNLGSGVYRTNFRGVNVGAVTIGAKIASSAVANSASVTVESAPATKLVITSAPATSVAGNAFSFTVTALDANNNLALGYNGLVSISSSDPQAGLPVAMNLTSGSGTFMASLKTVGQRTLTASDGTLSTTSGTINVTPANASQLVITNSPTTSVAGTPFNFTLTARDPYNNVATAYGGTVSFVSSDTQGIMPSSPVLTSGIGSFSATLKTAGNQTITAEDGTLSTTMGAVNVTPAAFSVAQSVMSSSSPNLVANETVTITLTTKDAFGNLNPINLPTTANIAFNSSTVGGAGTFGTVINAGNGVYRVQFNGTKSGLVTIGSSISGVAVASVTTVSVAPALADHLTLAEIPSTRVAGDAITFTVTARDSLENIATAYPGVVSIISTDPNADLPSAKTLTNGEGTFVIALKTAAVQRITATDGTFSVTSSQIQVGPGTYSLARSVVTTPTATVQAGSTVLATLTTKDAYGNLNPTGLPNAPDIAMTSTVIGGTGSFGGVNSLGSGLYTGVFTAQNTGLVTLGATISGVPVSLTKNMTVTPAPASVLQLTGVPTTSEAGVAFNFTVTAKDSVGNRVTDYSQPVQFLSSDASAVIPATTLLTSGTGTFTANLKTSGSQTITVQDNNGLQAVATISVGSSAASKLVLSSIPSSIVAGVGFNFGVTALDSSNNIVPNYNGVVSINSTDPSATIPTSATLVNGVGSFNITLKAAGSRTITVADGTLSTVSSAISVNPAAYSAANSVMTASSATVVSGSAINAILTTRDAFGNLNPSGLPDLSEITLTQSLVGGTGTFGPVSSQGSGVYTATFTGVTSGPVTLGANIQTSSVQNT